MGWNYEHMNQLWKLDDYSESIYYVYKKKKETFVSFLAMSSECFYVK